MPFRTLTLGTESINAAHPYNSRNKNYFSDTLRTPNRKQANASAIHGLRCYVLLASLSR